MIKHLNDNGVQTGIHYPIPVEQTGAFKDLFYKSNNKKTRDYAEKLVSLPIHPFMTEEQASYVVGAVNSF